MLNRDDEADTSDFQPTLVPRLGGGRHGPYLQDPLERQGVFLCGDPEGYGEDCILLRCTLTSRLLVLPESHCGTGF